MKYGGKKLKGRNTDVLVLMRGDVRIVFKFQAVESYKEFDDLVPVPEPPERLMPGGQKKKDHTNPSFRKALEDYAQSKSDWIIISSLKVTEDLEWERVKYEDPGTWGEWRKELEESEFTEVEMMRIVRKATIVNSLDDDMLEQARQDFLQEQSQAKE